MTRYLHTMYRITDPKKSRAFYEASRALPCERARLEDLLRQGSRPKVNDRELIFPEGNARAALWREADPE